MWFYQYDLNIFYLQLDNKNIFYTISACLFKGGFINKHLSVADLVWGGARSGGSIDPPPPKMHLWNTPQIPWGSMPPDPASIVSNPALRNSRSAPAYPATLHVLLFRCLLIYFYPGALYVDVAYYYHKMRTRLIQQTTFSFINTYPAAFTHFTSLPNLLIRTYLACLLHPIYNGITLLQTFYPVALVLVYMSMVITRVYWIYTLLEILVDNYLMYSNDATRANVQICHAQSFFPCHEEIFLTYLIQL